MPTTRTALEIRSELTDVTARAGELAARERETRTALEGAKTEHGRLHAAGAGQATVKRQGAAVLALQTELDGILLGIEMLDAQIESLLTELASAEAREALQTAREADTAAHEAAEAWQAFVSAMLADDGEFSRTDAALREAVERNRVARARAIDANPSERAELERRFANFWLRYPGAPVFSEAAQAYRHAMRAAPVQDAAA